MLYFCWIDEDTLFDPHQHCKNDYPIFQLSIFHEEGKVASAQVMLRYQEFYQLKEKEWALISYVSPRGEQQCLFKGKIEHLMHHQKGPFVTLHLIAQSQNAKQQLEEIVDIYKKHPYYDPLFSGESFKPEHVLAGTPSFFYWDRVNGKVRLSDFFLGSDTKTLEEKDVESESLFCELEQPISKIDVSLKVQWIQHVQGFFDLGSHVRSLFREKIINSYTGKSLAKHWPSVGNSIGSNSGYRVISGSLKEIEAPYHAPKQLYPKTFSIKGKSVKEMEKQSVSENFIAQRSWFKEDLLVGWNFQQKREETIEFSLESQLQIASNEENTTKKVSWKLQKIVQNEDLPFWHPYVSYKKDALVRYDGITHKALEAHVSERIFDVTKEKWEIQEENCCPSVQSTFFITKRGHEAFEHALERASVLLSLGGRCFKTCFSGPFTSLAGLTLDDSVTLVHSHLPNGQITGKVVGYELYADGKSGKQAVKITLASSIGLPIEKQKKEKPEKEIPSYANDYAQPGWQLIEHHEHTTESGIVYKDYDHQYPSDPYAYLRFFTEKEMIKQMHVKNLPEQQEEKMKEMERDQKINKLLEGAATKICTEFQRISGKEILMHHITPSICSVVELPTQVELPIIERNN